MSTYRQILYQIVFSTKNHEHTLIDEMNRIELFNYISGILKNKKCFIYNINGVSNHLHILTELHPSLSLSNLMKDIKIASSKWIKENNKFSKFKNWQEGYGAFTYSIKEKEVVIQYIRGQEEHHKKISFRDEYISLLKEHEIEFDERYLF